MEHEGDVITFVIGALGRISKGLKKILENLEIRERVETIQTILLKSARILRRVLETWGDLLSQPPVRNHLQTLVWKTFKKSQIIIIIIIIITIMIIIIIDASIQRLEDYIQKHDGELITVIRNDTDNTMDNRVTITRKQKWEGKQLYGRFKRLINI